MLTQERLKELLHYDPETGIFTWIASTGRVAKGSKAGNSRPDGYQLIRIDKTRYYAHRLAWLYVYKEFPTKHVDHINGNPSDNRLLNLREATHSQNLHNSALSKRNTSGIKGLCWDRMSQKWHARVSVSGKEYNLGRFESKNDASAAVRAFRELHHGDFANHGDR